ncbi:hypothetical protein Pelo_19768 [Pelomyxa schiedti]|nr:hypothetical protein Pelo_19768 [Pelomyxa schiedti]
MFCPLRRFPIDRNGNVGVGAQQLVTAERGLLFHHSTEMYVTEASTGALLMHLTDVPPNSMVTISSFENGKGF